MIVGLILGVIFVAPWVVAYALFIRWCDRFEPEPWWLLLFAFGWGAVIATLWGGESTAVVEHIIRAVTGASEDDAAVDAFGAIVLAPIFEEGFKGLGVGAIALLSAFANSELDGALDGAIYGGMVGLGFTLTEDTLYVANEYARDGLKGFVVLFFLRTVLLGLSHCTFTAMTGLGFGIAAEVKSKPAKVLCPLIGYCVAMGIHAMHNALPTLFGEGGLALMLVISWFIDGLFFVLLGLLVTRDRATVIRELVPELGGLLHPRELDLVSSYVTLSVRNLTILLSQGLGPFRARRQKQLALVELAFLKSRRRRGEVGRDLDEKEAKLRYEIAAANQRGVWIGS
jgi:RsiW-degrading membrane proteinase PrsW (M82 family)